MALNRLKQVLLRTESTSGTLQSPLAAAYGKFYAIDPAVTREFQRYERNLARDTITQPHGIVGTRKGRLTFGLELTGQVSSSTPAWDIAMKACGLRSVATYKISIGAVSSGPFRHGETITFSGTGGSGTAIVAHDTYSGAGTLYWHTPSSGYTVQSGSTITGSTSGASCTTSSDDAACGVSWYPISKHTSKFTYSSMTGSVVAGMVVKGNTSLAKSIVTSVDTTNKIVYFRYYSGTFSASETVADASGASNSVSSISSLGQDDAASVSAAIIEDGHADVLVGARGNLRFTATMGQPAMLNFDLYGRLVSAATVADQALITSIAYDSCIPPVFHGTAFVLGSEGDASTATDYTPRLTSFQFDMGNALYIREDAATAGGLLDCVITDRNVSGSFDPELDLEASYPFFQHASGVSSVPIGRCSFTIGSAAGNKFYVSMPGMQYDPPATGNRSGVLTYQIPFKATGGYLSTETSLAIGADNEFCITYLTA